MLAPAPCAASRSTSRASSFVGRQHDLELRSFIDVENSDLKAGDQQFDLNLRGRIVMRKLTGYGVAMILTLLLCSIGSSVNSARAQSQSSAAVATTKDVQQEQINHEVQLYLLVASDASGERSNIPQSLDGAVRQLKDTLPFANYRLASTFMDRVRDGGTLEVSGVGGFPLVTTPANSSTPTFFTFGLSGVTLVRGANDQPFIQVGRFRFGLKVPIQTGTTRSEGSNAGYPVIQYQDTGITTELSVREGVPTIIGTLAANQPNESYVLVLALKRTATR
ncbi:MAG TPA: hypothetical protein VF525_15260 [Pyrinomonadaceae bacterium]